MNESVMHDVLALLASFLFLVPGGFFVWRKRRDEARARGWITSGKALGLRFVRRVIPVANVVSEHLVGERDGVKVEVGSSVDGEERWIYARASFDSPAPFGVSATTLPAAKGSATHGSEIHKPALPGWRVHAHDAERATALLTRLDKLLRRYPGEGRDLTLDDRGVSVCARAEGSPGDLESLLDEALVVRRKVLAALASIGPGEPQRQAAEAWAAVAEREGQVLDARTGSLRGETDRFTVEVGLEHHGGLLTTLVFTLKQPTRGHVALGRMHEGSDTCLAFVGQVPAPTGDPAFDARFRVSARTREGSAAILDEGARAALLDLPEAIFGGDIDGPIVTLRADGVLSAEGVLETLRAVARLATHVAGLPACGYRDPG